MKGRKVRVATLIAVLKKQPLFAICSILPAYNGAAPSFLLSLKDFSQKLRDVLQHKLCTDLPPSSIRFLHYLCLLFSSKSISYLYNYKLYYLYLSNNFDSLSLITFSYPFSVGS
jgi:hypothetical protein